MDVAAGAELRLGLLVLLNAVVAASAWRFVRRRVGGDWADRGADAGLLVYLVQYVAVCGMGVVGQLGVVSMGAVAIVLCGGMWVGEIRNSNSEIRKKSEARNPKRGEWVAGACLAFLVGYLGALVVYYRHLPVMAQDALTYHFPAAATWIRTGRIGVFETWFFNPANAYSPLGGSAFIAWLMGPLGNDLVASFVQVPAVVALWFVVVRLAREVGLSLVAAGLVGTALVVAQPFVRAAVLSKDDVFVAVFFVAALAGLSRRLAADRLGPWRVGVAVGLLLAMKYTALLMVPVLLIAAVGVGWRWRQWGIVALCVAGIAGPWYVRNWAAYGNPVFPVAVGGVWPGLMSLRTSGALRSVGGVWRVLTGVDDALPAFAMIAMVVGWGVFCVMERRRVWGDPVLRALAVGPVVAVGLFVWRAPYAEVRFLYPVFALGFVALAVGVMRVARHELAGIVALSALLAGTALTGLPIDHAVILLPVGIVAAGVVIGVGALRRRMALDWTHGVLIGVVAGLGLGLAVFVYWAAYVRQSAGLAVPVWAERYGKDLAAAWGFVRELPAGKKVAYANTYLVYPLMGFEGQRVVEYVPSRAGVGRLADLPYLGRVSGDEMITAVAAVTNARTDEAGWLERIAASHAAYLFVEKRAGVAPPPELGMADKHSERFGVVLDNAAARVYEIR